jgi:hypothetical protein
MNFNLPKMASLRCAIFVMSASADASAFSDSSLGGTILGYKEQKNKRFIDRQRKEKI